MIAPEGLTQVSLLAITGPSCSGKDTLVDELEQIVAEPFARVDFDDYFLGTKRLAAQTITDWESPTLYRYADYIADLKTLRRGETVEIECHSRRSMALGIKNRVVVPQRWVVVNGFLALFAPDAVWQFNQMIYLDISEAEMVRRRLERITGSAGWDNQDYIKNTLVPATRKHVIPQKDIPGVIVLDGRAPPSQLAEQVVQLMK